MAKTRQISRSKDGAQFEYWEEETGQPIETEPTGSDLRTVGVSPGDFEGDVAMGDAVAGGEEAGDPALGGEEIDVNVDLPAEAPPA